MVSKNRGFTLIELMVVIAIIGILFAVVITATGAVRKSSRDTQREGDLAKIQSALQNYYGDQTTFPSSITSGSTIQSGSTIYLNKVPSDPLSGNPNYCYIAYTAQSCIGNAPPCYCPSGGNCQYYQLYAQLENASSGNGSYGSECTPGTNYNYVVTPP